VSTSGSDSNSGTESQPWQTIQKAFDTLVSGDTLYVRGGQYNGVRGGFVFKNSGTESQPITVTNYPNEQAIFKINVANSKSYEIFRCVINPANPDSWNTPKADHIKIIGTDVTPKLLSNNVESKKGIVIQGMENEQSKGITAGDCDYWEVAGVDFIEVSSGIFAFKNNHEMMEEHSTDHWHVHDNRVYMFYRESGLQFDGDENLIENNVVSKVTDSVSTTNGCQFINILGDNNIVRKNNVSQAGSTAKCNGIRLEWDLSDENIVEQNLIFASVIGIGLSGGDNNIIRNNIIYKMNSPESFGAGIEILSYDDQMTKWPCTEAGRAFVPPENPSHPDYQYYFNPRNCHSFGNQIYNNFIHGFIEGIRIYELAADNTIIRNNILSGWTRGGVCFYKSGAGTCKPLLSEITESNNAVQDFGIVDIQNYDFHLSSDSSLIDTGYDLGNLNMNDFSGNSRPQGNNYDIGAYEYVSETQLPPEASDLDWYYIDGNKIKDSEGNIVMLKGVNTAVCIQNEQEKFTRIAEMGSNVVRLLIWKNGIEGNPTGPCAGKNELEEIDKAVLYAKNSGLKIILDQQIWDSNVGNDAPFAFFTDSALQESWLDMWEILINRYKNEPTIIGIDLMNEPWAISGTNKDTQFLWEEISKNAYDELHHLNDDLIFFISGWGKLTQPMWSDIDYLKNKNIVISDHVYNTWKIWSNDFFTTRYEVFTDIGIPVWLGEIGYIPGQEELMQTQLNHFDSLGLHYTYWIYGVNRWDLPHELVDSDYKLTNIGEIYSNHIKNIDSPIIPEDVNNDSEVNIDDVIILVSNFGTSNTQFDLNNDKNINLLDLVIISKKINKY